MMFGLPTEEFEVNPVVSKALDKLLILHADHEQIVRLLRCGL